MDNSIKVMIGQSEGEITEKKSRFIAGVFEIHSEAEALSCLESVRRRYYDARHNCYAYVLGAGSEFQRFSDDKEPQGTAGRPILDVINGMGYHNVLVTVTRYFGGILLGTGGLVRAYSAAAREGLLNAEAEGNASFVTSGFRCSITCDYNLSGKIQYLISQNDIPSEDTVYAADVTFNIIVPEENVSSFSKKITEATNGASEMITGDPVTYSVCQGRPVPYEL
ncbi:MAG: YigZ family protein [Parasporobacterium sp.]|nr:YigZ family protein [Parasporobacterium sp.]